MLMACYTAATSQGGTLFHAITIPAMSGVQLRRAVRQLQRHRTATWQHRDKVIVARRVCRRGARLLMASSARRCHTRHAVRCVAATTNINISPPKHVPLITLLA